MEYRLLGRSGLKVSVLTMGTMTFGLASSGPVGSVGLKEARRQIDQCVDGGINLLDTANIYSGGQSEEIIGAALQGKRDKVLIATKARFNMRGGANDGGNSRINLIAECERSLKRLRTDVIDLYQVHEWDGQTPLEETMDVLDTLVKSGKVRYVGCSNFSGWHLMKALGVSERTGKVPFVSQQIYYTLGSREVEYELVPIGLDQGVGILVWSPLAGGLLSGKFRRNAKGPKGARHFDPATAFPPVDNAGRIYDIIDVLVDIADDRGVSGAQVALAWLLARPGVTSLVVGGRTKEQFADNLAAADLKLTREEIGRLDAVTKLPLLYPYWHQVDSSTDRLSAADLALLAPYIVDAAPPPPKKKRARKAR